MTRQDLICEMTELMIKDLELVKAKNKLIFEP
jgi:hypothetical protein